MRTDGNDVGVKRGNMTEEADDFTPGVGCRSET